MNNKDYKFLFKNYYNNNKKIDGDSKWNLMNINLLHIKNHLTPSIMFIIQRYFEKFHQNPLYFPCSSTIYVRRGEENTLGKKNRNEVKKLMDLYFNYNIYVECAFVFNCNTYNEYLYFVLDYQADKGKLKSYDINGFYGKWIDETNSIDLETIKDFFNSKSVYNIIFNYIKTGIIADKNKQ